MGGTSGVIEGKKKLEAWLAFKRLLRKDSLETFKEQEAAGLYLHFPMNKK